jgi:DNA-binding NarL/FixJ family response regulator
MILLRLQCGYDLMNVSMIPYRLIIADDEFSVREVLKILLEKRPDLDVVGEATDGDELLSLLNASRLPPDLIILDISMSRMTGLEVAPIIKTRFPGVKILILSQHNQREVIDEAVSVGVNGYLTKDDLTRNLFSAIDTIRRGDRYLSRLVSHQ